MIGRLSPPFWRSESSSTLRRSEPSFTFKRSKPSFIFWHSEPSFTFKRTESSSTFRRSEPHYQHLGLPSSFILAFGVILIVQSRISSFSIRSHHSFPVWHSEPPSFFDSAFRAASSPWHSESYIQFGVQSRCLSLARYLELRSQFWRSEPSSLLSLTFRVTFSVSAFRAIIGFQFDIQSRIFQFQGSESSSSLLSFGVQSHHHFLV